MCGDWAKLHASERCSRVRHELLVYEHFMKTVITGVNAEDEIRGRVPNMLPDGIPNI